MSSMYRMLGNRVERSIKSRREKEDCIRKLEEKVKENESIALQVKFFELSTESAKIVQHQSAVVCV